ncbi:hypothetical protein IWQ62_002610 [Dispira parvispora]|uniref:Mitochondrial import inner membrane translocase subunit TIM50 n=1 Tax=Dispira parvispora TaxID=1520584 RepID=A0A9W8E7A8_9FUNG|nr:hypothetical protein IWQ62_002610 [Dispira parvispora]
MAPLQNNNTRELTPYPEHAPKDVETVSTDVDGNVLPVPTVGYRSYIAPRPLLNQQYQAKKSSQLIPLLVICDLNGTLLRRRKHSITPRPHLEEFMAFLLDNFHVMVWSSAIEQNVSRMIDRIFGQRRQQLVGVWDRRECRYVRSERSGFRTEKELTRVWYKSAQLKATPKGGRFSRAKDSGKPMEGIPAPLRPVRSGLRKCEIGKGKFISWKQMNTIIIDDSPDKVGEFTSNHIQVSDFERYFNLEDNELALLFQYFQYILPQMQTCAKSNGDVTKVLAENPWLSYREKHAATLISGPLTISTNSEEKEGDLIGSMTPSVDETTSDS